MLTKIDDNEKSERAGERQREKKTIQTATERNERKDNNRRWKPEAQAKTEEREASQVNYICRDTQVHIGNCKNCCSFVIRMFGMFVFAV